MSQSNSIAGAFAGAFADGPVQLSKLEHSPEEHQQLQRLYDQAYWLGKCAELIYAPSPDKQLSKQEKKEHVKQLMKAWHDAEWDRFFTAIEERLKSEGAAGVPDALAIAQSELSEPWKQATEDMNENDVDDVAEVLRGLYRKCIRKKYFYPWRWFSEQRLKDMDQARQQWEVAHEVWVQKARKRIAGDDDGLAKSDGRKVKFGSHGGMEYFLAGDANLIILCFRGTEPNKLGDVVTDLLAWQSEVGDDKAKVHDGFWNALNGVWPDLSKSLTEDLTTKDGFRNAKQPETQKLWITGHSLGGALAALAAYRLVREQVLSAEQIGGVFTFGQPRVGDSQLSHEYKDLQQNDKYLNDRHFRFVNNNDIVTTVPPKSLLLVSIVLRPVLQRFFGSGQDKTSGDGQLNFTFEYSDVGRVVLACRSDRFKLLTPPRSLGWKFRKLNFWWPVRRWTGWIVSLVRAPFMPKGFGGFTSRFLPCVADHSMTGYNRALKNERDLRRTNEDKS